MATLEQDFPSLTNDGPAAAPRPKIIRQQQPRNNNRLAVDDQNFPALGSEANIRLNIVESRPTSSAVTSANISVQMKPKTANAKRPDDPVLAIAGPSTSTLSLTWVNKAKEKKAPAPAEKAVAARPKSSESVPKPPTVTKKNFPRLINSGLANGGEVKASAKNKKSSVAFHVDETDTRSRELALAGKLRKPAASSEGRPAAEPSSNDDKTASFLLNASRKKVKMKDGGEAHANTLPKSVLHGASGSRQPEARCANAANIANQSANCNNRNCDTNILGKLLDLDIFILTIGFYRVLDILRGYRVVHTHYYSLIFIT